MIVGNEPSIMEGEETMYDVFAPSSTPSAGRVVDHLSFQKSCHTLTTDVINAYFHVDEDEECYVDPSAEWPEQQASLGNWTSVPWRLRRQLCGPRRAGTRWVDFIADIEVHMDDLHGTGPRLALDLTQTNFSQKILVKIWTVNEVGMGYKHLKRERVLHNDRTDIVPNPKYLRVVLHNMALANCKPAPTPSAAGSVKQKLDDDADLDVQECRLHCGLVGNLQYLSIDRCDVQFGTNDCAKEMRQPTKAS